MLLNGGNLLILKVTNMRKQLLLCGFNIIILSACQDNLFTNEVIDSPTVSNQTEGIYPSSTDFSLNSRNLSFENNWENNGSGANSFRPNRFTLGS
jgi:hypothetical protein